LKNCVQCDFVGQHSKFSINYLHLK
jgi:hypothetical protein